MKPLLPIALCLATAICFTTLIAGEPRPAASSPSQAHIHYLPDGSAEVPSNYRDWPFLSAGVNMNYSDANATPDHPMIDNVFVDPDSLRVFRATGKWPEGTVFVKEDRMGSTKGSINKSGQFQSEVVMAMEMHVKDTARFKGGWAFFMGDANAPSELLPPSASCYACHQAHGAVDSTFVQFYPTVLDIARKKGTFSAGYRQDEGGASTGATAH